MIHIGIDASRASHSQPSGVEWYATHIISHLLARQPHQWIYHLYNNHVSDQWPSSERVHNDYLRWPPQRLWTLGRLSWEMARRAPDLLFIPAHVAPIITPARLVVTIHDVGWRRWPQLYTNTQRWYLEQTTRRAVAKATRILTISEFTKNELVTEFHCPASRIQVTPLGFDRTLYQPATPAQQQATRAQFHLPPRYVLFVGRQDHKKNIRGLLEAWTQLQPQTDTALVFVGPAGNATSLIRYQQSQPAGATIHNFGWTPETDIARLYAAATTLVLPSLYEGFGLPLIQAQACGVPVITSNTGAMAEITPRGAIHVDPLKPAHISNAIRTVLDDAEERQTLQIQALANAQRYSWEHTAELTVRTFAELLQFIV